MDWITRNPASARLVPRFEESRAEELLDHKGYAAVGQILRDFQDRLMRGQEAPFSWGTLCALRVAIYTGVRHRSELLSTRLDWCHLCLTRSEGRSSFWVNDFHSPDLFLE